jgi:hypothetical protein
MKKYILILLFLVPLISQGATYYVKNGGNDSSAGTSDGTAWAYCPGMASWTGTATIAAGDSVLFNRGDTWRLQVINSPNGTAGNYVYYGAYGSGNKPIFMGSKEENATGDWEDRGGNIWRNSDAMFADYEVGNIVFNNDTCGRRIMSATPTMTSQGDWYYNLTGRYVEVYSVSNPATYYTDIECCIADNLTTGVSFDAIYREVLSYSIFQNLRFIYWGSFGCYMLNGSNHNQFLNLEMEYIGGDDMSDNYVTRYGNGITCWHNASYITVDGCKISQVFDSGISPQGGSTVPQYDVNVWYIRNNIITKCEIAFEYFYTTPNTADSILFENNTCVNSGYGWSHNQRTVNFGCDVRIGNNTATTTNVIIRNNIFYNQEYKAYHFTTAADTDDVTINYNCVLKGTAGGTYYLRAGSTTYSTYAAYHAATGFDQNVINSDPLFISFATEDFHLQSASPVRGQGQDLTIATDYDGETWLSPPSMGALEYIAENPAVVPVIETSISPYYRTHNSAVGKGNVTSDGGGTITARGICWSTSANPTISDSHTHDGTGTGAFTSRITGLKAFTTYYFRAYATNAAGTAYGANKTMKRSIMVTR